MSNKELTPVLLPPLVAFTGYTNSTTVMEAVGRLDDTTSDTLGDELTSLVRKTLDKGINPNFSDIILNSLVDGTLSYPGLVFLAIVGLKHEFDKLEDN